MFPRTLRGRLWWLAGLTTSAIIVFCGVIGFAHTQRGRPLLPYLTFILGEPKSCPLGYDQAPTVAQFARGATSYLDGHAHAAVTAFKVVPDFVFGETSRDQLKQVLTTRAGTCSTSSSVSELECLNVKTALGSQSLWARFDDRDRLANVRGVEMITDAKAAAVRYRQLTSLLEKKVGPPTHRTGAASTKNLESGLLYQAASEYAYRNYSAVVRVTNMGRTFAITTEFNDPEVYAR